MTAWKCTNGGCPDRAPVHAETPPRCYTCGVVMPPLAGFDAWASAAKAWVESNAFMPELPKPSDPAKLMRSKVVDFYSRAKRSLSPEEFAFHFYNEASLEDASPWPRPQAPKFDVSAFLQELRDLVAEGPSPWQTIHSAFDNYNTDTRWRWASGGISITQPSLITPIEITLDET